MNKTTEPSLRPRRGGGSHTKLKHTASFSAYSPFHLPLAPRFNGYNFLINCNFVLLFKHQTPIQILLQGTQIVRIPLQWMLTSTKTPHTHCWFDTNTEGGVAKMISTWAKTNAHEDLTIIKRCKLQWYGHVSRSSGLAKTILQGTVKGEEDKANKGRCGKTTLGNGQAWSSASPRG